MVESRIDVEKGGSGMDSAGPVGRSCFFLVDLPRSRPLVCRRQSGSTQGCLDCKGHRPAHLSLASWEGHSRSPGRQRL